MALVWVLSAMNSLQNMQGFSLNQLVFVETSFPSFLIDDLPVLEGKGRSHLVADNLNTLHAARKALTEPEASEKI